MIIPDLSFTLGSIRITPFFWSLVLTVIFSSFSFWRWLKEDYREEVIFNLTLLALVSGLFFGRLFQVAFNFNKFGFSLVNFFTLGMSHNFSLAGAIIGVILPVFWKMYNEKGITWDGLDALTLPLLFSLFFGGIGIFFTDGNFWDLGFFCIGLLGLIFFPLIKAKYRSFPWYRSGKTGFMISFFGLISSLLLLILAFCKNGSLYLSNLIWLGFALASGAVLYYRSERNLREDFNNIFKKRYGKK